MLIPQVEEPPPVVGFAALLMVWTMVVIIFVVPLLMGRERTDDERSAPSAPPPSDPGALFSSDRERRLWIWTGIVLFAIYSTLAPAAELAAFLRERNLLRLTSAAVLLTVVTALAVPWLKRRPGTREVGAAIGIAAVYVTTLIRIPNPEARSHL